MYHVTPSVDAMDNHQEEIIVTYNIPIITLIQSWHCGITILQFTLSNTLWNNYIYIHWRRITIILLFTASYAIGESLQWYLLYHVNNMESLHPLTLHTFHFDVHFILEALKSLQRCSLYLTDIIQDQHKSMKYNIKIVSSYTNYIARKITMNIIIVRITAAEITRLTVLSKHIMHFLNWTCFTCFVVIVTSGLFWFQTDI
jgi:hypothetical protein